MLRRNLPDGLTLTDLTADFSTLIVTGPQSRALLESLGIEADLSLGWLTHQHAGMLGVQFLLARVSFAGELGWEVHASNRAIPTLYKAINGAGAKPFGMWALNSLRIEKGYRAWKGDLSTDYSLLEGGLDRFIKLDKATDFPGKAALLAEKQRGVKKRFACLTLDAPGAADAPYMSTIWHDGQIVGETTSGAWGYRVGKSIALGMLRPAICAPGTKVEVEIYGERFAATVQGDRPLWDPDNARIRA
jgi:dimethylglycine dehydrogenase